MPAAAAAGAAAASPSLAAPFPPLRLSPLLQVLEGHEAAVLCLLQLPNGDLLSGSGDCTIRVWSGGKCTHTIPAHSDSVRWAAAGAVGRVSEANRRPLPLQG